MSELWVKRDGVVGHWFRWYLLMCSILTLCFYTMRAVVHQFIIWMGGTKGEVFDPAFLLIIIPLGILWGDVLYEKDRKANTPPKKEIL